MRKYERACPYCKEKGHRARECELKPAPRPAVAALTETQFHSVKDMQQQGDWCSSEVAEELRLPLKEVNAAFGYFRYDIYLHYRRSRVMV